MCSHIGRHVSVRVGCWCPSALDSVKSTFSKVGLNITTENVTCINSSSLGCVSFQSKRSISGTKILGVPVGNTTFVSKCCSDIAMKAKRFCEVLLKLDHLHSTTCYTGPCWELRNRMKCWTGYQPFTFLESRYSQRHNRRWDSTSRREESKSDKYKKESFQEEVHRSAFPLYSSICGCWEWKAQIPSPTIQEISWRRWKEQLTSV